MTHVNMDALSRRLATSHYNGNNGDVLAEIEGLSPVCAAYVGAYVLGSIDSPESRDFWMRVLARRAEMEPK
jgi:hypothetical protein